MSLPHIVFLLDQSWSMLRFGKAPIDALNEFLKTQAKVSPFTTSIIFFDNTRHYIFHNKLITSSNCPKIQYSDYNCQWTTSLYDSIYETLSYLNSYRPDSNKIIFVVLTDGMDTTSRRYTESQSKEIVEYVQTELGWKCIYIHSLEDSLEGAKLGFKTCFSFSDTIPSLISVFEKASFSVNDILNQFQNMNI